MNTYPSAFRHPPQAQAGGFTLIELLAAIAILLVMVGLLFAAFNQASRAWLQSENRVETFTQARAALDYMSRELTQAIVRSNVPFLANYDSLAFVAPVSTTPDDGADLIEVVYRLDYVEHSQPPRPLLRRTAPLYATNSWDFYDNRNWPETFEKSATLADNIISLRFDFVDVMGSTFSYWNSMGTNAWCAEIPSCVVFDPPGQPDPTYMTNRAPAGVLITIGVIDSRAAQRLKVVPYASAAWSAITNEATQYFSTFVAIPNR